MRKTLDREMPTTGLPAESQFVCIKHREVVKSTGQATEWRHSCCHRKKISALKYEDDLVVLATSEKYL